jgi:hypothetical protein
LRCQFFVEAASAFVFSTFKNAIGFDETGLERKCALDSSGRDTETG